MRVSIGCALRRIALFCLAVLILETSVDLLPNVVFLKYFTVRRLILLTGLAAALLAQAVGKSHSPPKRVFKTPLAYLAMFISFYYLLTVASTVNVFSSLSFSGLRLLTEEILAGFLVFQVIDDERTLKSTLAVFLIAVSVTSLIAIQQVVTGENTNFFLINAGKWIGVESIDEPAGAIVRATAVFGNPNLLAAYLVLLIPIAFVACRALDLSKGVILSIIVLAATALAVTFSRGAIAALAIGTALVLTGRKMRYAPMLAVAGVASALFNPLAIGRFESAMQRTTAWATALKLIAERPLFGIGLGNFKEAASAKTSVILWHAHNLYLNVTAESGIASGLAFIGVMGTALYLAFRGWRREKTHGLNSAMVVSLVSFALCSLVDDAYNSSAISYTFWLLIGLSMAAWSLTETSRESQAFQETAGDLIKPFGEYSKAG